MEEINGIPDQIKFENDFPKENLTNRSSQNKDEQLNPKGQILFIGLVCFFIYFSMYMVRKPFTAATFEGIKLWGLDYKLLLVVSQVLGYATSKFLGIKIVSELTMSKRIPILVNLLLFATISLIGFALSPTWLGPFWLFLNGLPLGLVWGVVFSFCEGRRITEILAVILSANFIFSSGLAKFFGRSIIGYQIPEQIMPVIVAIGALPIFFLAIHYLKMIPLPDKKDLELKSVRLPMSGSDRKQLFQHFWFPISLFTIVYLLLTVMRDVRDNFMVEILSEMGIQSSRVLATTEMIVTIVILLILGFLYLIKNNKLALVVNMLLCFLAVCFILFGNYLLSMNVLSPTFWMTITGIGLFLPYIILNGIAYDRFIATYKIQGNVGFIMYLTDAVGYLASVSVLLIKSFYNAEILWYDFYRNLTSIVGFTAVVSFLLLIVYFWKKN